MMRRPRLLLVEFVWEIVRLAAVFGLAALALNREGYIDAAFLLFLVGVPALIFPAGVLLLYLDTSDSLLRRLLVAGKGLMVLTEGLFLLLISVLGLLLSGFVPLSFSQDLPRESGPLLLVLFGADLLFLLVLLLFKPPRSEGSSRGIPEAPIVRIEEE
jgi:hypothetical protein